MDANIRPTRPLLYVYMFLLSILNRDISFVINMIVHEAHHSVLCMLDRHTVPGHAGVQNARTACLTCYPRSLDFKVLPYKRHVLSMSELNISQKGHTFCPSSLFGHNVRSKYPAIIYVLKGLSHVPFKMDTHNVHANRIWLPVSARAVGNAPVGE